MSTLTHTYMPTGLLSICTNAITTIVIACLKTKMGKYAKLFNCVQFAYKREVHGRSQCTVGDYKSSASIIIMINAPASSGDTVSATDFMMQLWHAL